MRIIKLIHENKFNSIANNFLKFIPSITANIRRINNNRQILMKLIQKKH